MAFVVFNDLALLHDANPVGHFAHHAQIMRNQQNRHAVFALQIPQQIKDLFLNGHIKRGGRLVGNQQAGAVGKCHGNHHPLALTAGQFMRQGTKTAFGVGNADTLQKGASLIARGFARQAAVQLDNFRYLLFNVM